MYKVNEIAKLSGVSVRTLHHYDRIGLLKPSEVAENGYRLYSEENLTRLQQILFFKELDFPLKEIQSILDHPNFDQKRALLTHKQLLEEKKLRLERIIQSVEKTIQSIEGGIMMDKREMFEPFDMKKIEAHQKKYEQEVKEKYGDTDAYAESKRKTSAYTEADWKRIKEAEDDLNRRIILAMPKGPGHEEVQKLMEEKRQQITKHYYDCKLEIFRGLGDLYVNDERFKANYEKMKPGLAEFMREAMHIYCDNQEKK